MRLDKDILFDTRVVHIVAATFSESDLWLDDWNVASVVALDLGHEVFQITEVDVVDREGFGLRHVVDVVPDGLQWQ